MRPEVERDLVAAFLGQPIELADLLALKQAGLVVVIDQAARDLLLRLQDVLREVDGLERLLDGRPSHYTVDATAGLFGRRRVVQRLLTERREEARDLRQQLNGRGLTGLDPHRCQPGRDGLYLRLSRRGEQMVFALLHSEQFDHQLPVASLDAAAERVGRIHATLAEAIGGNPSEPLVVAAAAVLALSGAAPGEAVDRFFATQRLFFRDGQRSADRFVFAAVTGRPECYPAVGQVLAELRGFGWESSREALWAAVLLRAGGRSAIRAEEMRGHLAAVGWPLGVRGYPLAAAAALAEGSPPGTAGLCHALGQTLQARDATRGEAAIAAGSVLASLPVVPTEADQRGELLSQTFPYEPVMRRYEAVEASLEGACLSWPVPAAMPVAAALLTVMPGSPGHLVRTLARLAATGSAVSGRPAAPLALALLHTWLPRPYGWLNQVHHLAGLCGAQLADRTTVFRATLPPVGMPMSPGAGPPLFQVGGLPSP